MNGHTLLVSVIAALATVVLGWGLIANFTIREDWGSFYSALPTWARKGLVLVAGLSILALAVALSPLPGPGGLPLAYLALTILGFEFTLALKIRSHINDWLRGAWSRVKSFFRRGSA